jgi:hypothetical protein
MIPVTVGDIVSIASILKVGKSLGASIDEIKAELPAITKTVLDLNADLEKLQSDPQLSETLQVDLGVARDDAHPERHDKSGNTIQALDITGDLNVRFNQIDSQKYNVNKARRLTIPFQTIWLSNAAQLGKVATLVLGKGGQFQIQDVSPSEINIIASEVTLAIAIESSTIMMPIDLQSSYIMMPIDIQAQYMNLAIDIVAQSIGTVAINIAGQIENVTISLAAQSVGIFLQPEWAASQQTDKNLVVVAQAIGNGGRNYISYTVPSGKTLMITHVGGYMYAADVANADKNHIMAVSIYDYTTDTRLFWAGGNGGVFANPTKAIRIPTGHTIYVEAWNFASFSAKPGAAAGGYEV